MLIILKKRCNADFLKSSGSLSLDSTGLNVPRCGVRTVRKRSAEERRNRRSQRSTIISLYSNKCLLIAFYAIM